MYQQDLSRTSHHQDAFTRVQRTYSSNYAGETSSQPQSGLSIPISIVEDEFKQQARRIAYEQLLFRMFGNQFECTPISGGFSGSSVLKISPYDQILGTKEEAVIVKLDSASNIKTEVTNSLLAHKALGDIAARILGEPIYYHNELDGNDYGAFKMELAGACWYIPEFSNSTSSMINTFKDSIVYESEEAILSAKQPAVETSCSSSSDFQLRIIPGEGSISEDEDLEGTRIRAGTGISEKLFAGIQLEGSRPFGTISAIIKELFGLDGSATRSLRRFEATAEKPLTPIELAISRRISRTDPNHPSGGEFLIKRLPVEILPDTHASAVLKKLIGGNDDPYHTINKSLRMVKERLQKLPREFRIIRGFCHGDLNASNILIDAMEGMWMIDFATARKLPLTSDLAKLESSFLFEYCFIPVPWEFFLSLKDLVPIETVCKWFRLDHPGDDSVLINLFHENDSRVTNETQLDALFVQLAESGTASWASLRSIKTLKTISLSTSH
jgi:hypothetical protein